MISLDFVEIEAKDVINTIVLNINQSEIINCLKEKTILLQAKACPVPFIFLCRSVCNDKILYKSQRFLILLKIMIYFLCIFCNKIYMFIYPILDTRISSVRLSRSDHPPWILKRGGLESSGQRLISSIGKTKGIAFFFFGKKKYF